MNDRALLWARSGLVWLLLGMAAGLHIGIAGEFGAASHHAHAGLLGGLWAIVFAWLFDKRGAALTIAARAQWALYNIGVVVMAVAMFLVVRQSGSWGPVIGIGGILVILTTIWIVIDAWPRGERPA
jgi:hypothetical protein